MKTNKIQRVILATVTIALTSSMLTMCKKSDKVLNADATVVDTGDPSLDGCGYFIELNNGTRYKPSSLPEAFRQNNLKVNISYVLLTTASYCSGGVAGPRPAGPLYIDVKKITIKNQ